ncbi:polysaccharide pyruvyl transferase family protein [Microbacterium sp. MYb62]|uniref:polysaccharide pyruvyl transferase family protein n=1 Tax=Microbacterium sp. MYb62 TaxID=1848690 RepID=UPI000CFBF84A|nr:polysaccharide pyruvyl transferase family protein [Microbacterium sp. MYb62]PRB09328.1 polysaccharide pyruvyl transferase [Microbacterium sp. MYb62]
MSPTILLRSSWQTVNIGDVAHSPGALRALSRYAPGSRLILWPIHLDERERSMFARAFPEVEIVHGELLPDGTATTPELTAAIEAADVLVHGSAPSLVRAEDMISWAQATGKPYGFFGVSLDPLNPVFTGTLDELETMVRSLGRGVLDAQDLEALDGAAFIYCRDSITELFLRTLDLRSPVVEFGPDATFAFDVTDEESAAEIKRTHGLHDGEYLCVVPRVRWTPYFEMRGERPTVQDIRRTAYNALWVDHDLGVLAATIVDYVRRTGHQVLVVPEMAYAVGLAEAHFGDALPSDVRPYVQVLPRFWSAPEALTVYRDAEAVVSIECHSPLMAISQNTPAVYVRQPTDTVKGRMYDDVGAAGGSVEISDGPLAALTALRRILDDPSGARAKTAATRERAQERLRAMVGRVISCAGDRRADLIGAGHEPGASPG